MTKQWEKYREVIIAEYKGQNKPLHEVQRIMRERYGFKASTRAYRSRFDRWQIHKYSRRKSTRSTELSVDLASLSPQDSPDVENNARAASPLTPNELLSPDLYGVAPTVGSRRQDLFGSLTPYAGR
ncbi:hypothetical protein MMYC01_200018 [Madurella mycetomatis]|uniref:Clr5 domain-containing protein n=1 Tax=Madurella mycetomatis TaxID=100816 RepID=A0A150ASP3_9PEZI|nr:hypothetical protein MMYC01_200018 [Madurella mycetomatis]